MGSIWPSVSFIKSLFCVLSLLVILWLLPLGVLDTGSSTTVVTTRDGESLKPMGASMRGREKGVGVLNMSKRKVYNGPDPIHNRRNGNYRQPPGRV